MKNIYANPVGKISKDIYIIKNDINNKVYIGQSINTAERFKSHCKRNNDNSLIDKAIQKYGKQHFWYEILEEQVEDYNEKEKYWINFYNSLTPNGYNILSGGDEPPLLKGEDSPSAKLSDKEVISLKEDLKNTSLSLSTLAEKYHISKRQVLRINQGLSRAQLNEQYPIRQKPNINGKLTEEDVDEILDLLAHTYRFNGDIAKQFGVDSHAISRINSGISHHRDNIEYPIREWKSSGVIVFTYEQVTEIINALQNTTESITSIAKRYGVTFNQISQINRGTTKKYRRKNIKYPIRPY